MVEINNQGGRSGLDCQFRQALRLRRLHHDTEVFGRLLDFGEKQKSSTIARIIADSQSREIG